MNQKQHKPTKIFQAITVFFIAISLCSCFEEKTMVEPAISFPMPVQALQVVPEADTLAKTKASLEIKSNKSEIKSVKKASADSFSQIPDEPILTFVSYGG